ncbi:MAG: hypothetical protein J6C40_01800, partial [Lentisphaeria bacterium]|nr:hypothetical protein [Lentisphaeria bacterium]
SCEAISTLRLYFRRHFKAATSVPPLDHVRVRPGAGYALRADFFISLYKIAFGKGFCKFAEV